MEPDTSKKNFVILIINIFKAVFFVKNTLKWYFSTRKGYNNTTKKKHKNQKEKLGEKCNFEILTTVLLYIVFFYTFCGCD
jgi:amino acid permease